MSGSPEGRTAEEPIETSAGAAEEAGEGRPGRTPERRRLEPEPADRMDGVPDEFRPWLTLEEGVGEETDEGPAPHGGDGSGHSMPSGPSTLSTLSAPALELRGLEALRRALSAPGRNRDSAFHLLAADAYLTWAAEAFLGEEDPEDDLRAFLRRVIAEDG